MSVDQVSSELRRILAARNALLQAMNPSNGMIDAVQASAIRNKKARVPSGSAEGMLLARLGHIPVNPSNALNTYCLINSYVHGTSAEATPDWQVVNQSEQTALSFLNELVGAAKLERQKSDPGQHGEATQELSDPDLMELNRDRFFLLSGSRGSGKTFFLNHLFSRHHELLDSNNVIWVRLNLTTNRQYDNNLVGWIHAQIAKLLLRYYDVESAYSRATATLHFPFYADLADWITRQKITTEQRLMFGERLLKMRQVFMERGSDTDISPALCQENLCLELFRIARARGLSFIVIFDGYDRLDHDRANRRRFQAISEQIGALAVSNAAIGAVFLVVSRTTTFEWLRAVLPFRHYFENRKFAIASPKILDIASARLDSLHTWASRVSSQGLDPAMLVDLGNLCTQFKSHMIEQENKGATLQLDSTMQDNARAKIQIVQLLFQQFCQKRTGHGYRLVELMVKAGFEYPPLPYNYTETAAGVEAVIEDDILYDSRFVPILTRPAIPRATDRTLLTQKYAIDTSCLHGIRLLQLLEHYRPRTVGGRVSGVSIRQLCDTLHNWFGYNRLITSALIYEYECFELLHIHRFHDTYEESEHDTVSVLGKTAIVFNSILFDIAYLNHCAMRTLATEWAASAGLFQAARLNDEAAGTDRWRSELESWARVKVENSIAMASILMAANEKQRVQFKALKRPNDPWELDLINAGVPGRMFALFDDIQSAMAMEIYNSAKPYERNNPTARALSWIRGAETRLGRIRTN